MLECRPQSPVEIHISMVGVTAAPMRLRTAGFPVAMEAEAAVEIRKD